VDIVDQIDATSNQFDSVDRKVEMEDDASYDNDVDG